MALQDDVRELIANGDKEAAIKLLASALVHKDSNDAEAWLLLGEIIDDPAKRRDCYNRALKLSPNNRAAQDGLRKLDAAGTFPAQKPDISPVETQPPQPQKPSLNETTSIESLNNAKIDWKGGVFASLGVAALLGLIYLLGFGGSDDGTSSLYAGLTCSVISIGFFAWYTGSQYRGRAINNAIQKQKQAASSGPSASSSHQRDVVSCRTCQHAVSRTAEACPNCGEYYPGLVSKCPHCGSRNIRITPKGFRLGQAAAGAAIAGPVSAAGGLHGRQGLEMTCSDCQLILAI